MKLELISDLIFDAIIYPRHDINRQHVSLLGDAFDADENLPPLVACKNTKKIIDGIHRWHALIDRYKEEAKWYVKWESFSDDNARFMRSVQLNAHHGLKLDKYDRAHCYVIAQKLGISTADLAAGFGVKMEKFEGSVQDRFSGSTNDLVAKPERPLKRQIRHMAGHKLTKKQIEINEKLDGLPTRYHADQIIYVIDGGMLEKTDEHLFERLKVLYEKLEEVLAVRT